MRSDNLPLSLFAAVAIGVAQTLLVLPAAWIFISLHLPILRWLLAVGLEPAAVLHTARFVVDPIINLTLSLPAALAICLLRPRRILAYLLLAVVPGVIWEYRFILSDPAAFRDWLLFLPGLAISILAIPAATLLTRRALDRRASK